MDEQISILRSKFLHVFLSLLAYFTGMPFLRANHVSDTILSILFSLLVLVSINVTSEKKPLLITSIFFGILSLGSYWQMIFSTGTTDVFIFHYVINIVFLFIITCSVVHTVASQNKVTPDTLFGAISAYLLIGLTWSYIYLTIHSINPDAFTASNIYLAPRDMLQHFIYYSFITLTTVGYGDIVATTNAARMFSWIESVTGQIYLAVWISQLVGLRIVQKQDRR